METLYLDLETTGINATAHRIIEIAIVNDKGEILLNQLVNPGRSIPSEATAIHGITEQMVAGSPLFSDLWPQITLLLKGKNVVIYNADFDRRFFPDNLDCAGAVSCCMKKFAAYNAEWNEKYQGYRWLSLDKAMKILAITWQGDAHRALADTFACRAVWQRITAIKPV